MISEILMAMAALVVFLILLVIYFIVGITIRGKMTGGATFTEALKEIFKELFGIRK
jgi:uncharacterized membrane protein